MNGSFIFPLMILILCVSMLYLQMPNSNYTSTKKTISVILHYKKSNPLWADVLKGINDAINEQFSSNKGSYTVSIRHPGIDVNDQDVPDTMQNLVIQELLKEPRPIAIICSIPEKKMINSLNIANERGIPIYVINSGLNELDTLDNYELYIAQNENISSEILSNVIAEKNLDNVLILRSKQINSTLEERFSKLKKNLTNALVKKDIMPIIKDAKIDNSVEDNEIQEEINTIVNTNMNVKCVISIDGSITYNIYETIKNRINVENNSFDKIDMFSYEYPGEENIGVLNESSYSQGYLPITFIKLKEENKNFIAPKQKIILSSNVNYNEKQTIPKSTIEPDRAEQTNINEDTPIENSNEEIIQNTEEDKVNIT